MRSAYILGAEPKGKRGIDVKIILEWILWK
jgi:hypothetical protein